VRIVVVSSHYPPDFTSGGTLVPQRHARALRDRGHDVRVYAGSLNRTEPYDDLDETGLPVRWFPVGDAVAWDDRRNYDNSAAAADFARYLVDVQPELVHLHSLQAMGGELVAVAKRAGARVVVTMHDFWWSCGRQFLVDKQFRPCSLVVEVGVCGCQVDRTWLDARNAQLTAALASADVVCAPSRIAAAVGEANGLADVVVVDENGLPPLEVARSTEGAEQVRFLYAGGKNRLKGVRVLHEAVQLLPADGWSLTVYGTEPATWPAPVRVEAAYDPEQLSDVLRAHDVLVIPSLMRETYSILTREALQHGLAVLTSDSLGPEEVVEHGRNGLVVATGDTAALAAAMTDLIRDHELLARLRSAPAPEVRRLADQVDGLEQLYRTTSPKAEHLVRHVLFVVGIQGAPLRYRAQLPAEALDLVGVGSDVVDYRHPDLEQLAAKADVVVLYRVPATTRVLDLVDSLDVPALFDVDDLVVDPSLQDEIPALRLLPPDEVDLWMEGVHRYRTTLEACDGYIGSTALLCDHIGRLTGLPSYRFWNGVGTVTARKADAALRRARRAGPLRVGYFSGTTTHDRDWQQVEPAVLEVLARHPDVELHLVGPLNPTPAVQQLGPRLKQVGMQPWQQLPELLRDLDVNLAPLELELGEGGRFNEAKSAIKFLEAALAGTPTIATPTQPFREAMRHDVNGLLATTHEEWVEALDRLLSDAALRSRLGSRARRDVLLTLSPHLQGRRYRELLEQAVATGKAQRTTDWVPVAPESPPRQVRLDPYGAEPVGGRTLRERIADSRVGQVHAEAGVGGVVKAALRVTGRRITRR
jgi:glycosyltransferase involved in cell wall biosynthesis